ncbi:hypothetical protein BDZ45DRAFT_697919 [Acephala macrosclerotiorum]|nr:hypothetical protein BDZ45DRAFT_697919 [Acephala macrosclerotiorum]
MKQVSIQEFSALPAKERSRSIKYHRLHLPDSTWGFAIFRTVCTAESNLKWGFVLEKLNACVHFEFRYGLEEGLDPEPNDVVADTFENMVFDDEAKFNNASLDVIRETFRAWARERGNRNGMWAKALVDAPDLSEYTSGVFIKVVDRVNYAEDSHPEYEGWVKAKVGELWRVYQIMSASMGLGTRCEV